MEQVQNSAKLKYHVLKPGEFDDHEVIALLERTPAFNRDARFNDEIEAATNPGRETAQQPRRREPEPGDVTITF